MAVWLAQGAILILGPLLAVALYGRGRALRWDVVVVGAIAYVLSEPFRILTAPIFGAAAIWQALSLYVPLRVYGVRERDEPVTLGLAYGGAMAVSAGIAGLTAQPEVASLGAAGSALLAAAAGMWLLAGLALFAGEAARARQARWLAATAAIGAVAALGLPELVAAAAGTWWLSNRLQVAQASDRTP
jgi:hypothetical protein